jgi:uncharacterized BrkB/YihY/UPF0761 family membrane protein
MKDDELEGIGREWLRVVELVKRDGLSAEHDHVRFRDSDLSIKGAAILGFSGLMLAADLVFLSAENGSFIAPERTCGSLAIAGFFVLIVGAFCAVISIMISRKGSYQSAWSSFGLMKLYHDRRLRWLRAGGLMTCLGTLMYLVAMIGVVSIGKCAIW